MRAPLGKRSQIKSYRFNMASKYYAVVSGRKPGIYNDWPTAEGQVKAFPGAIFKSFRTKTEAEQFLQKSTAIVTEKDSPAVIHTLPLIDKTIIYTDGSYSNSSCGFGVVVITTKGDKITARGRVPLPPSNNVAELYSIYVALSLVRGDAIIYSDSQYAIACLTTYVHDWMKNGWAGVANRNIIEGTFSLMKDRNIIFQHVQAHTGIQYNEEADRLAEEGRKGTDCLTVLKNGILQNLEA